MRILRVVGLVSAVTLPVLTCETSTVLSTGNVTRTFITDSPFPYHRVARVDLYVVSVSASLTPDTSAGSSSFVTLATPHRLINVLALQNGMRDELGSAALPSGSITAVRMVIDTDSSSITLRSGAVLTGNSTPGIHWQSSAGRPVLNALVNEQINVPTEGGHVVIDYDVGEAFIPPQVIDPTSTDSGFVFSPVLRAVDETRSGWIVGTVRAQSSSGSPVVDASLQLYFGRPADPENTWSRFGTAMTDAAGNFRFSSVTRSDYWSTFPAHVGKTYIVTVDPPPGSPRARMVVPNITVSAAVGTDLGTVALP
jgi:uncharacterized protein DUF4382